MSETPPAPYVGESPPSESPCNHSLARRKTTVPLIQLQSFDPTPVIASGTLVFDKEKGKIGMCIKVGHVRSKEGVRVTIKTSSRGRYHYAKIEHCLPLPDKFEFVRRQRDGQWFKVHSMSLSGAVMVQVLQPQLPPELVRARAAAAAAAAAASSGPPFFLYVILSPSMSF